jgi:AcrR family transcriptional regulator
MRRNTLPSDEDVRAAVDELLNAHFDGGPYPSVSALANRLNVDRTTFYRHYSPIATAMLDQAAERLSARPKRRRPHDDSDDRDHTIRRLRDENNDLRHHLEIYEEHLRMLTIENNRQREQLDQIAGVSNLNARRTQ